MSFETQISNRNFLSPGGFRFTLAKYPKVAYFAQMANIPNISLSLLEQPTPYRDTYLEGVIDYGRFNLQFLVDENMENYLIMHNWMRGLGVPERFEERQQFIEANQTNTAKSLGQDLIFADGTLVVLNSNFQPLYNVVFKNLKPVELSTLEFDGTLSDQEYFQAIVSFDYLSYEIQSVSGDRQKNLK
tara:strand:+ start:498 stop:1058 length:561 start_codon:yes stop_codon:yes gene_type:complete